MFGIERTYNFIIDFRKHENDPEAIIIKEKEVDRVEAFKYLGVVPDNKLKWENNPVRLKQECIV